MATSVTVADHSGNTQRSVRNVVATGDNAGTVANHYAAKSTWTSGFTVPPQVPSSATWTIA